jgi:hypothetical protein
MECRPVVRDPGFFTFYSVVANNLTVNKKKFCIMYIILWTFRFRKNIFFMFRIN